MKDLFDFDEHTIEAKNELLLQMMVSGGSMSKDRADDLGYEYFCKKFGEEEMRRSELVWYYYSDRTYDELEREGLISIDKKWMNLTDDGKNAVRLTYRKYLFRKKVDKIFRSFERAATFIKNMATSWRWLVTIVSLLAWLIVYLVIQLLGW